MVEDKRFPPDVQVKKGFSWTEQMAIAIACLVEDEKMELINWIKDVRTFMLVAALWANLAR